MATTSIIFLTVFFILCAGAVFNPLIGIIGYILLYHTVPETYWWGASISHLGIRYSYLLVIFTVLGIILNTKKLNFGDKLINRHEWLAIIFLAMIWLSVWIGLPFVQSPNSTVDPIELKMTKLLIFILLATHIVTTVKRLNLFLWAIVIGVFFLAYQTYTAPSWKFVGGRLNSIVGPDFREANDLAAHFVACLPFIAVQFVRSGWIGRVLAAVSGAFAFNGIILTRSRGAFVALIGCMFIGALAANKRIRKYVIAGLIVACIGGFTLVDQTFWMRASTIIHSADHKRDLSTQSRMDIWVASVKMLRDHPFGVGAGNFVKSIAPYNPERWEKDAHNTFVSCYSELGIQGLIIYGILIFSAIQLLLRVQKESKELPQEELRKDFTWLSYAFMVSLCAYLFSGLTIGRLYSEGANWILIALPVCLWRALQNARLDADQSADSVERVAADSS
jgi:Lipid A core - O-antigen ligase and related enzymes